MTVYILEVGEYDGRWIVGVYSTLEKAAEASNSLGSDDGSSITPYEVDPVEEPPVDAVALERERLGIKR